MFCMDCVCRHGNTSLACLVMWLMAASPVSGCTVETRQSQDPLRGTCNPTMGLHYAYTSYSAQKGAYIHTKLSHHDNATKNHNYHSNGTDVFMDRARNYIQKFDIIWPI